MDWANRLGSWLASRIFQPAWNGIQRHRPHPQADQGNSLGHFCRSVGVVLPCNHVVWSNQTLARAMRYRLRTLVIAVAVGPPAIAVAWMAAAGMRVNPVLLGAAIYVSLVLTLIAVSWGLEVVEKSRLAGFVPWRNQPRGRCFYCLQAKRPLAEGAAGVLICRECAQACVALLDKELQKQQAPADSPSSTR